MESTTILFEQWARCDEDSNDGVHTCDKIDIWLASCKKKFMSEKSIFYDLKYSARSKSMGGSDPREGPSPGPAKK